MEKLLKCGACHLEKLPENFYRNSLTTRGFDYYCKSCRTVHHKKQWVKTTPERKEKARADMYLTRYGLPEEVKLKTLQFQDYKCAACSKPEPGSIKGWCWDHDHTTGHVRGVLCQDCNVALGRVHDSVSHLENLVNYLKLHKAFEVCKGVTI